MGTRDRPQLPKRISNSLQIQDGNPRINPHIGEWVTSIDLSDAYLHIPIHPESRKFLRFHHKETSYQFTSLPFGLATAPLVFTSLVKEVKLLALKQDIHLHQYLDDWLIRASSQVKAQKHTSKLLSLVRNLGFIVNLRKSELTPQQRFVFIGYRFLLDQGLVRPTNDRWKSSRNLSKWYHPQKWGAYRTTHPADGAGRNPNCVEHGFLPFTVKIVTFYLCTYIYLHS